MKTINFRREERIKKMENVDVGVVAEEPAEPAEVDEVAQVARAAKNASVFRHLEILTVGHLRPYYPEKSAF